MKFVIDCLLFYLKKSEELMNDNSRVLVVELVKDIMLNTKVNGSCNTTVEN